MQKGGAKRRNREGRKSKRREQGWKNPRGRGTWKNTEMEGGKKGAETEGKTEEARKSEEGYNERQVAKVFAAVVMIAGPPVNLRMLTR